MTHYNIYYKLYLVKRGEAGGARRILRRMAEAAARHLTAYNSISMVILVVP